MSVIVNEVRRGSYLDSVALMRIAQAVKALDGVEECGLMMGTPANRRILTEAGVLVAEGETAGPGDLVIALRAVSDAAAEHALAFTRATLDRPRVASGTTSAAAPRTVRSAIDRLSGANLALISVPGAFAVAETRKALASGLNVMLFSDNVPIEDEAGLKREAGSRGLLLMGPDCGTAIIGGTPLAFANVVPRGEIGIIGASGTGIQEISTLVARSGGGISHAIGTGGRDLKAEVGGTTTLMAIELLDADPATRRIVIVSKPPAPEVARRVLRRIAESPKSWIICFIGGSLTEVPANARVAATLEGAAALATGQRLIQRAKGSAQVYHHSGLIRGLFAGGTLCAEAQVVLRDAGLLVASNVSIEGAVALKDGDGRHTLIDLGDDDYTLGRPHPMIDPSVRDEPMRAALAEPRCAVLLVDCVLGYGAHRDPGGHIARLVSDRPTGGPTIIASVTGTEGDPQGLSMQSARLAAAGIHVAPSNAAAARMAVGIAVEKS